jgi:acyl phosphate:glycerol-3-phosphate acyltransferase
LISLFASAALGYLLGSFPTAYVIVRFRQGIDIRKTGSGNVGTLNSYLVSRSAWVGVAVLLIDGAKGALAGYLGREFFSGSFDAGAVAACAAVLGHNYPLWLGFRGGRGLAPAAGAFLVLGWSVVPAWLLLWAVAYLPLREVNAANAVASAALLVLGLIVPGEWLVWAFGPAAPAASVRAFGVIMMCLICLKLIDPIREFVLKTKGRRNDSGPGTNGVNR